MENSLRDEAAGERIVGCNGDDVVVLSGGVTDTVARVCLEACPVLDLCRQRAAQGDLSGIVAGVYYSVVPSLRHADPA